MCYTYEKKKKKKKKKKIDRKHTCGTGWMTNGREKQRMCGIVKISFERVIRALGNLLLRHFLPGALRICSLPSSSSFSSPFPLAFCLNRAFSHFTTHTPLHNCSPLHSLASYNSIGIGLCTYYENGVASPEY